MKKLTALFIIASLFITSPAYCGTISLDFSGKKEISAALRSMLMPGWGQHYNEEPVKTWVVFGLFAVTLAGAFYYNNKAFASYDKYKEFGMIDSVYYDDYESQYLTSQIFTFAAIGVWLYGMVDAYVVAKYYGNSPRTSRLNFYYDQDNDGYYLTFSKKI